MDDAEIQSLLDRNALTLALPVAAAILGLWVTFRHHQKLTEAVVPPLEAPIPIEYEVVCEIMALCIARLHRQGGLTAPLQVSLIKSARDTLRSDDPDAIRLAKFVYAQKAASLQATE